MAKKRKGKYPNLDRSQNTKSRTDYIESEYIDGVFDKDGRELIRPLNEEEKAWLDQFYGEVVAVSDRALNPTPEIEKYMKEKKALKQANTKIRKEKGFKNKNEALEDPDFAFNLSKIKDIEDCLDFLRKEYGVLHPTCDEHRKLYSTNNTRNFCIYNNRKARGMLLEFTELTMDTFVAQYWNSLAVLGYDSQDITIETVEKILRADGFLGTSED